MTDGKGEGEGEGEGGREAMGDDGGDGNRWLEIRGRGWL